MKYDIRNMEALEFLKEIKSKSIDLVLTDPPYEISRETGFANSDGEKTIDRFKISYDFGEWDQKEINLYPYIEEMFRTLKDGGTCIIFYDLWKISYLSNMMEKAGFKQLRFLEWVKTNPVPINSKINYLTNAREIAILGVKKGKPTFHSEYDNGIYKFPIYHGKDRFHPTQKSVALFEELVKKHSNESEIVLDCFLGSGTTAIASVKTNRKFVGCEMDIEYYNKMINRIEAEYKNES